MKRNLFGVLGSVVLAGALVAAQDSPAPAAAPEPQPAAQSQPAAQPADRAQESADETTLTGCLVQGSGPTVFILENAKLSTAPKTAKGDRYVLDISAPADKIKSIINHQVTIVGTAEKKAAPAAPEAGDQKVSESDLPKLTAKRITPQADTCSAQGD